MYGILALAFSPPPADAERLHNAISDAIASLQASESPSSDDCGGWHPSFPQLSKEYLRLFVGPGHIPCPPYESVHRKDRPKFERGLVMGPSASDVRRTYSQAGVDIAKKFTDLPDHVAVEMEFMHFLCSQELKSAEAGNLQQAEKMRAMQRKFLEEHIKPWIETFADSVTESTTSPFYKDAANLLKTFTNADATDIAGGDPE